MFNFQGLYRFNESYDYFINLNKSISSEIISFNRINSLFSFSNGSGIIASGDINITLAPSESVYIYDNWCTDPDYILQSDFTCEYHACTNRNISYLNSLGSWIPTVIAVFVALLIFGAFSGNGFDFKRLILLMFGVIILGLVIGVGIVIITNLNC